MSENDIKLVSSVPSNLANGQPASKAVPDRVAPKIAPERAQKPGRSYQSRDNDRAKSKSC